MKRSELFERCLHIQYTHVEKDADYALERVGSTLYLYFESSNGLADWTHNFNFPAKPYKRMGKTVWFAHRGFLEVWKKIETHIAHSITDPTVKRIVVVGYSHGGAIATLCHEYAWFHRPDLRTTLEGYGFAAPRVFWGLPTKSIHARWANYEVIRNGSDIVTHLPPTLFGFTHVGNMIPIGTKTPFQPINDHRPESILSALRKEEQKESTFKRRC